MGERELEMQGVGVPPWVRLTASLDIDGYHGAIWTPPPFFAFPPLSTALCSSAAALCRRLLFRPLVFLCLGDEREREEVSS